MITQAFDYAQEFKRLDLNAVIKDLDAGGDFAKIAKSQSKDTASAANGSCRTACGEGQ